MKIKKILIFISDEGFGHIVRQRSLIKSILKNIKYCEVEVITSKKILLLKETFKNKIKYHHKHNLIETIKKKDGSIDKIKTKKMFHHWLKSKKKWINDMCKKYPNPDLIISDSVPQAFELAKKTNTKSINISHFTWNWFYKKHCKNTKSKDKVLYELDKSYNLADNFLILPLTPAEIIKKYKKKHKKINFMISDFDKVKKTKKKINCLIMDNGTKTLSVFIKKTIPYLKYIKNVNFFVGIKSYNQKIKKNIIDSKNIFPVNGLKKIHHTIPLADFVIARAGFNTITETLILKKPAIFFNEVDNEETSFNIKMLRKLKIISIIKSNEWGENIIKRINKFLTFELNSLTKKIKNENFLSNGANQATDFIVKDLRWQK